MKCLLRPLALAALLAGGLVAPALADPHKDESGHGYGKRHGKREHKEEYWDGRCKVERKWEKNGEYKEERKCKERSARPRHYDGRTMLLNSLQNRQPSSSSLRSSFGLKKA